MRHTLAIWIVAALGVLTLSGSAFAQQPGACSNILVGNVTFMRCQGQSNRDSPGQKSGGTTDPAAVGKPYGSWTSSFGDQHWQSGR